ncbi:MAG: hypothetical protein M1820_005277 [Bogoriella megaspora]|nr:MAG: hypothetical protein M1820_005277 [Bogoriella megaspora]
MPSTMRNFLIAALAAGLVQAAPAPQASTVSSAASSTSTSVSPAQAAADLKKLSQEIAQQVTAVDRIKHLLGRDDATAPPLSEEDIQKRVVFDFNKAAPSNGSLGGRGPLTANRANFPILTGLGISTAVAFLEPCGFNTPHVHPRATEFLTVTQGSLQTGFVLENGFTEQVNGTLGLYEGTVFPQGSIHFQQNPTCDETVFVATLNSDDPGASQIAQNFFALDDEIIEATLGFPPESIDPRGIDAFRSKIPANIARGVESCLKTCGIEKYKH